MKKHQMLVGGKWADPASGEWFESVNPFTAKPWALVPRGSKADVDQAIAAASCAFHGEWRKLTATARGALLHKFGELIAAEAERLAEIESTDNGKLIAEMRGQLNYIPQWFYYFGGLADKIEGRVIPIDKPGVFNFTREEPLGVVAAITPWNSPLLLATWKLAPALAAGNTVVWKPSEFSSVSAFAFGELFEKAGFPPGVVNIVTGFGNEVGEPLITHQDVAKVAFTGGDKTGEHVYGLAARGIKPVTLELGGKSAEHRVRRCRSRSSREGRGIGDLRCHRPNLHRRIARADPSAHPRPSLWNGCSLLPRRRAWAIRWTPQRKWARSPRGRNTKRFSIIFAIAKEEGAVCRLGGAPAQREECGSGLVRRAHHLHRRESSNAHRERRSVRPGLVRDPV